MRVWPRAAVVSLLTFVVACEGSIEGTMPKGGESSGSGASNGAGGSSSGPPVALPPGMMGSALLPARIRRLSDAEYQATVTALVGQAADRIAAEFVPDARQSGFTLNDAQRVDPLYAGQVADAAELMAADIKAHAQERAPCANASSGGEACAKTFIESFGKKAYRRELGQDEVSELVKVFKVGADGAAYEDGIELVARAMLQSAAFLYLTEIGSGTSGSVIKLTPEELASSISYLILGRPPSDDLLARAKDGLLADGEKGSAARHDYVMGSLMGDEQRARVVRLVSEWLGIDGADQIAKDSNVYKRFEEFRPSMARETGEFMNALLQRKSGSVVELLGATWTQGDKKLAELYGVSGGNDSFSELAVPERVGLLNRGAFLSVYAHAHETAPVLRGVSVMRRVACVDVKSPADLGLAVPPVLTDDSKTTRQRLEIHSKDALCATCHKQIDAFGFSFEHLDGMGAFRATDSTMNQPVDSSTVITGTDFDGAYADSNELATAMSKSKQVKECFARHVFRGLSARNLDIKPSEAEFVKYWSSVEAAFGGDIVETMAAFISSPSFTYRRAQ